MTTLANPHVDTVAMIYEAFGRGDVPAILARLAPDVLFDADWPGNSAQQAGLEHMRPRRGRAEVASFFSLIGQWQVDAFEVCDLLGSSTQVVAQINAAFTLPNGGRLADQELHLWTFGSEGLITRFRHYVDTAKHIAVAAGADTTAPE